jgi:putative peptidoglycan lipid II flippase
VLRATDHRILRATLTVGALTLLTKAGFVGRDLIVAWRFGRSPLFEAFLLAFVIPYSVTNAISSSLTSVFLPDFIRLQRSGEHGTAKQLYSGLLAWLLLVLAILMILCVLLHPLYVHIVAASLSVESWKLMRNLLFLTAPAAFLGAVAHFWQSILNAEEKFFPGSAVFMATPLISIGLLFFSVNTGVMALSLGLLLGAAIEVFALGLALRRKGVPLLPRWGGASPVVRYALGQWAPFIVGVVFVNAMSVVDNSMAARLATPGSVAALNYGRKAVTFPLDVSAIAFVMVTLPYFSKMAAAHDWAGLRNTLRRFLALIFALNVPVALALAVWSKPIVRWLFERGQFGPLDTEAVAGVLFYYAFSLPFFVAFLVMMKLLSSLRARVPSVLFSAAALALDVILNYILSKWLGVAGIGLATTCVYFILVLLLNKYISDLLGEVRTDSRPAARSRRRAQISDGRNLTGHDDLGLLNLTHNSPETFTHHFSPECKHQEVT